MNETHVGNENRSKPPAPEKGEGASGNKSNDCEASLRRGNIPPSSAVTTIDPNANKGKAIQCAQKQNTSDEKAYPKGRNVIPQEGDNSVLTHPSGGELQ